MPCVPEPVDLVEIVIAGWKSLNTVRQRRIGNAVPVLDGGRAEPDVVPGIRLLDADMMRDAKAELMGFVFHCLHDVAVGAEELDAVRAHPLELAHTLTRLRRILWPRRIGEARVDENPRARDVAAGAVSAEIDYEWRAVRSHFAERRYSIFV